MNADQEPMAHVEALQQAYPRLFKKGSDLDVWFPRGWTGIMNKLCAAVDALLDDGEASRFRVEQVKEKFGSLRFYYSVAGKSKVTVDISGPEGHFRASTTPRYRQPFPAQAIDTLIAEAERDSAFAERLGWTPHGLTKALKANRVFFVELGGQRLFPAFLADPRYERRQLEAVCRLLDGVPGGGKLQFFLNPRGSLNELTPLQALAHGQFALVKVAAEGFAQ